MVNNCYIWRVVVSLSNCIKFAQWEGSLEGHRRTRSFGNRMSKCWVDSSKAPLCICWFPSCWKIMLNTVCSHVVFFICSQLCLCLQDSHYSQWLSELGVCMGLVDVALSTSYPFSVLLNRRRMLLQYLHIQTATTCQCKPCESKGNLLLFVVVGELEAVRPYMKKRCPFLLVRCILLRKTLAFS